MAGITDGTGVLDSGTVRRPPYPVWSRRVPPAAGLKFATVVPPRFHQGTGGGPCRSRLLCLMVVVFVPRTGGRNGRGLGTEVFVRIGLDGLHARLATDENGFVAPRDLERHAHGAQFLVTH